jgi:hypothetical protein
MSPGTRLSRLLTAHGTAATVTVLLIGGCIGSESAAFPLAAPPERPWISPASVQHIGWDCDRYRCRSRPKQSVIRLMGRPSANDFLARLTPYLNCCNAWSVPYYGYAYGPELSLPYDVPMAPVGFAARW